MRTLLLVVILSAANPGTGFARQRAGDARTKAAIVAFFDEERLTNRPDGQATLQAFEFFLKPIQQIAKRDFPDADFRILKRGEFLRLPDGTGLNVQNIQPAVGYVLSARGRIFTEALRSCHRHLPQTLCYTFRIQRCRLEEIRQSIQQHHAVQRSEDRIAAVL